ncbi:MAG: lasso RiPP family leader peptide-containing protein [Chloroflexi bacterium]|nr:lasso RiPP family leader peptide-containing protein [Chloroflexota bacterium]
MAGRRGAQMEKQEYRKPELVEMGDLRAKTLGTSTGGGWSLPPNRANLPPGSLIMPDGSILLPDGKILPPEK